MVNAFWLDRDPTNVRRWLVDRHVTSSVFECSMVLTTAARLRGLEDEDLYFTHPDHPLTRWAARSHSNWSRLRAYTKHAHEEWRFRWAHGPEERHGAWATAAELDPGTVRDLDWPAGDPTDPPQLTGRWTAEDYVDAYRLYYANEKRHLFAWTRRERPPWIEAYTVRDDGSDAAGAGE